MTDRRCLVMATFNMDARPWSGVIWEFAQVIAQIEATDILAPRDRFYDKDNPTAPPARRDRIEARWRRLLRQPVPRMPVTQVAGDYDLAIYICQFVYEVPEIARFHQWRQRSRRAAVFVLEAWPAAFPAEAGALAALDAFDHVFVLNGSAIPAMKRYTSAPVTQLSSATDMLRATPVPGHPARVIDLCCIGRNDPQVHAALLPLAESRGWFYLHDVWRNQNVAGGWDAVRRLNADMMRRSRYALVWDPAHRRGGRSLAEGSQVLSTRYFEAAAGGAVLLGSAPDCPEYHAAFDWPDALVPLPDDPAPVIDALQADPARVARIRAQNMRQTLLRHDWSCRWAQVLATFGLQPTPAHLARQARLAALAMQVPLPEPGAGPAVDHRQQEPGGHQEQQSRRHPHQPSELVR